MEISLTLSMKFPSNMETSSCQAHLEVAEISWRKGMCWVLGSDFRLAFQIEQLILVFDFRTMYTLACVCIAEVWCIWLSTSCQLWQWNWWTCCYDMIRWVWSYFRSSRSRSWKVSNRTWIHGLDMPIPETISMFFRWCFGIQKQHWWWLATIFTYMLEVIEACFIRLC